MCDDFNLLLNKKISAIINKYKDVDDSMDLTIDIETHTAYVHQVGKGGEERNITKPHVMKFNRIYNLLFLADNFYDLYTLLFD
ncbi:hypothetical protein AAJ76_230009864 [Vairimorpha ceranae]|uniref:Uncharacterized protein n=1 Tax=Vairimorpha ceranae TaxID=40302 RepID=A0A0F9WF42_9MICR|nr:hypothetical protein AAJ76_230009864 [Vairimorpha ceranae]KAF5140030.1 hypothetical protein G9O61_00g017550 [Vairimorpha ceranae]KKO75355.1 hypothetical protein AAJ76_230009864 [Vairimorpha ceranae]